jgi:hypothetical protein
MHFLSIGSCLPSSGMLQDCRIPTSCMCCSSLMYVQSVYGHLLRPHSPCRFPAFQRIQQHLARAGQPEEGTSSEEAIAAASAAIAAEDIVFMRWKERSFDSKHTESCGLTIQVHHC